MKQIAAFCAFLIVSLSPLPALAQEPGVESFSPQDTVKNVRQVTARFTEQMVSFGDPRLADPFDINCPEKGRGRWTDGRNWVYDFDKDLPAGVACQFTLKKDLRTLSGRALSGLRLFAFSTGGPSIRLSIPAEGDQNIDEHQIFVLGLDAEASEESVLSSVSCSIDGIRERVGVEIITGNERDKLLRRYRHLKDKPVLMVRCRRTFPSKAGVRLIWGKGVTSLSGISTTADQALPFKVRSPFAARFSCERENAQAACIPLLPMRLDFTAPVAWDMARKASLKGGGRVYHPAKPSSRPDDTGEGEAESAEGGDNGYVNGLTFKGPFPENSSFVLELPKDVKDDAGRPLSNSNSYPLKVETDAYPPLAKFSARFGIIELKGDAALPVTLRNLEPEVKTRTLKVEKKSGGVMEKAKEGLLDKTIKLGEAADPLIPSGLKDKKQEMVEGLKGRLHKMRLGGEEKIIHWLRKVASAERKQAILQKVEDVREFDLPKPGGAKAFEVIGIPLKSPGLYVVELESRILGSSLLGAEKPMYVPTMALVTNLSAHFKWGRESSLVWVTSLDKAAPVSEASVSVRDCNGRVLWKGKTDDKGLALIKKQLPREQDLPHCELRPNYSESGSSLSGIGGGLFVFARSGDDMTFVHSGWEEGIEPWRYNLPSADYRGPVIGHTIMDRSLVRAGETVHMKHIIRRHTMEGVALPKQASMPEAVVIEHLGSDQKYEFPLKWDRSGVSETDWQIPREAKLGHYNIRLAKKRSSQPRKRTAVGGYEAGDEEHFDAEGWTSGSFRVEEFRVPLMKAMIQPRPEPLIRAKQADVDLLVTYLSGGGAGGLDVRLRSRAEPRFTHFTDFEDFTFANGIVREEVVKRTSFDEPEAEGAGRPKFRTEELKLDKQGSLRATIPDLPSVSQPHDILMELEFRDPSGEVQTVSRRMPLWPSGVLVGIRPDSWAASKEDFRFHVAVVDLSGKPLSDRQVAVDLFRRKTFSHRKRLVGGFYSYEHSSETKRVGKICGGKTDSRGILICSVKSPVSGNVILQARAEDDSGAPSVAHRDVWIMGKGELWFDVADHDRIDLLPEKKRYEAGETARFQVRMPFREATALVTIEREGVMESFIRKLSGKNPVIDIPVKKNYAPNVFVSALVVRGRVSEVQPTAMVDLGKPAFKLGISEISVGWKPYELAVKVTAGKEVYRVRDKASIRVKATRAGGGLPPKGTEVAIAAVDEGLLELMPNQSWKLLEAMMGRRGYEVTTATAQMQVVGKRHYGLKALPQGGGGGRQATRELFDTLLLWKARVPLDAKGEAEVEVPLNDSLTSFRIAAVANGGAGMFGTGQTSIRTSQDLMILSGLPPVVREGDRLRAGFTVRNASQRPMELDIRSVLRGAEAKELEPRVESLTPGEAKELAWDVRVPYSIETLGYEVTASERAGTAQDRISVKQKVAEAVPVRVTQATLEQVDKGVSVDVERPSDAIPGKGGLQVSLRPRLSNGLGGVAWFMKRYPYTCMEQKISRAVALRDEKLWRHNVAELPAHLDSDGLVKYFPAMTSGSDVLTSYILAISHEAGWEIPADTRGLMQEGLKGFIEGRVLRYSAMPTADLSIRKIAALEALSRFAKPEPKLLGSIALEPNLWPTSAVIDWTNLLLRMDSLPNRESRLTEAQQILRSRMNFQGTTMGFSTEGSDHLWWLMVSADQNAVKAVLTGMQLDSWKQDIPRMVRGALGRQHRGHWNLTTANAWGVLAMEKFSKAFETVPVSGTSAVFLDHKTKTVEWSKSPEGKAVQLSWPKDKERLSVSHQGDGRPWAVIQGSAAIPLKEAISSGYRITKTLTAIDRREEGKWSRGDVLRVRLDMEAQADMTWVVVNDPIPAGSAILGTGLGRDSQLLTSGEKTGGWVWPVFEERSLEAFRAYYEFVPKGKWAVEYTIRLNNPGTFLLPPTRVEALYAPEMLGEIPNKKMEVQE